jgi:hypothetical protein
VALLIAGGVRWLVTDTHPEAGSTVSSEALGCAWAAVLTALLGSRAGAGVAWKTMLAGAMLVGGPVTALLLRAPLVEAGGLTMALALTPVVVAVASAAMSRGESEDVAGKLWPGLAAIAGLLLVLATPTLSDVRTDVVLGLTPVLTGVGAALFCVQGGTLGWRLRTALVGAAVSFGVAALVGWGVVGRPMVSVAAVAWDGVLALLSLLALARLGVTRWASQFVLLPLVILLEGIVLVRPAMSARWGCGLVLLAVAGVYLLLQRDVEAETTPG